MRPILRFLALASAAVLPVAVCAQALHSTERPVKPPQTIYIKAGHLFDATSDKLRDNMVLVVEGERITRVAAAAEVNIPAGAKVVDLSSGYVLPGLIDCHTHLEARSDKYDPINQVKNTPFLDGFHGVVNAEKTLQAGFTSVRDVGSNPFFAVDLRNTIALDVEHAAARAAYSRVLSAKPRHLKEQPDAIPFQRNYRQGIAKVSDSMGTVQTRSFAPG